MIEIQTRITRLAKALGTTEYLVRSRVSHGWTDKQILTGKPYGRRRKAKGYYKIGTKGRKYQAQARYKGKMVCLGSYTTKKEAHQAYLDFIYANARRDNRASKST